MFGLSALFLLASSASVPIESNDLVARLLSRRSLAAADDPAEPILKGLAYTATALHGVALLGAPILYFLQRSSPHILKVQWAIFALSSVMGLVTMSYMIHTTEAATLAIAALIVNVAYLVWSLAGNFLLLIFDQMMTSSQINKHLKYFASSWIWLAVVAVCEILSFQAAGVFVASAEEEPEQSSGNEDSTSQGSSTDGVPEQQSGGNEDSTSQGSSADGVPEQQSSGNEDSTSQAATSADDTTPADNTTPAVS